MTRDEVLSWLELDGPQLDRLLARGLPTLPGGQYSANDVAEWISANNLAEQPTPEPVQPASVFRTRREAAAALGRSIVTIDGWIAQGCPGENGHYDTTAMRAWRDERDRQNKRPTTYGRPGAVSQADVAELRELVEREFDPNGRSHFSAVCEAVDAVMALGPTLPDDEGARRTLVIQAICPPFKPWIPSQAELPAKIEERMQGVLALVPSR